MPQLQAGLEPIDDFCDEFSKLLGDIPQKTDKNAIILQAMLIDTILGSMLAIADEASLYLLEFVGQKGLEREIKRLRHRGFTIIPGNTLPLTSIKAELSAYFEGGLTQFKTPHLIFGSPFQQQVWGALCQIPYGETRSYAGQAASLGKPNSYRAVANANAANQLSIIIPCHRVIASNGTLGGYAGGLGAKQWLIEHERKHKKD